MAMQLAEPINIEGISFEPRVTGQTTLFPLSQDLQRLVENLINRAVERNKHLTWMERVSGQGTVTAYIHDWVNDEKYPLFREAAQQALAAFNERLAPYIDGLSLKEQTASIDFCLGPPIMSYEARYGNVRYTLVFRVSEDFVYLIVSPELGCTLPDDSNIRPALVGLDNHASYERVLGYVFRRNDIDRGDVKYVSVTPCGFEFPLKPVIVSDIPTISTEFSAASQTLEENADAIHKAASLIIIARAGDSGLEGLEKKLKGNQTFDAARNLSRQKIQALYEEARNILGTIHVETPTLTKYIV